MNIDFLNNNNVAMLWDVISDEDVFKTLSRDSQVKISQLFSNNLSGFIEIERKKTNNLVEINKKYIMLILNHIKGNFSQQPQQQQQQQQPQKHNKIKILEDVPVKELITYEEIQSDRKSQFDKDFEKRQEEFTNFMTIKVPEVPNFTDNYEEKPISEMDKIIKEMTAKRNYEVEQINRSYQSDINNVNNWLKPQETSMRAEKIQSSQESQPQNQNYNKSKYISSFDLSENTKKNVTWGDNEEIQNDNDLNRDINELETNIFKKLKPINKSTEIQNISLSMLDVDDKNIKNEIQTLNKKLDMILELLKK